MENDHQYLRGGLWNLTTFDGGYYQMNTSNLVPLYLGVQG